MALPSAPVSCTVRGCTVLLDGSNTQTAVPPSAARISALVGRAMAVCPAAVASET